MGCIFLFCLSSLHMRTSKCGAAFPLPPFHFLLSTSPFPLPPSLPTFHFPLSTSPFPLLPFHFSLSTSPFPLPPFHFPLSTSPFPILPFHFPLSTSPFPLPPFHFPLSTSSFSLPLFHFPLSISPFPLPPFHFPISTSPFPLPLSTSPFPLPHFHFPISHMRIANRRAAFPLLPLRFPRSAGPFGTFVLLVCSSASSPSLRLPLSPLPLLAVLADCTYVGMVDERRLLLQHSTSFYLVDAVGVRWDGGVSKELMWQQAICHFACFTCMTLHLAPLLADLLVLVLEEEEREGRRTQAHGSKQEMVEESWSPVRVTVIVMQPTVLL
ncbi:unnamed protein product [Closterium sp. Naga37s-1]|nr:unnamed protein product [Closterium sp. Naga37s-1]